MQTIRSLSPLVHIRLPELYFCLSDRFLDSRTIIMATAQLGLTVYFEKLHVTRDDPSSTRSATLEAYHVVELRPPSNGSRGDIVRSFPLLCTSTEQLPANPFFHRCRLRAT